MSVIEETKLQKILRKSEKNSVLFSKIRFFSQNEHLFSSIRRVIHRFEKTKCSF